MNFLRATPIRARSSLDGPNLPPYLQRGC
jgi:hypothetical protein